MVSADSLMNEWQRLLVEHQELMDTTASLHLYRDVGSIRNIRARLKQHRERVRSFRMRFQRYRTTVPISLRRECPRCGALGNAREAAATAGTVIVTLRCANCRHQWEVQHDSPPLGSIINTPRQP